MLKSCLVGNKGLFALLLLLPFLFVACSDNKSSSGVSFSKELLICYEEYVDLHGDIKTAFKADQKITSKAEYGQKHYEGVGAAEGRELPKSCHAYIDNRDGCWLAYANKYPDLLDNFVTNYPIQTDEQKIKFAKTHYSLFGVTEQRTFPNGCSNVWIPPPPKPDVSLSCTPLSLSESGGTSICVFGVQVTGTAAVPDYKLLYAAKIMAEYLDQDNNGVADNQRVTSALKSRGACLGMTAGEEPKGCQSLYVSETIPGLLPGPNAAFEEILHVISESGYAHAYPSVFGESKGTSIANAMDTARGGYQGGGQPVSAYPAGAWYTYDDPTCDYACMVTEYFYWGLTSMMGAQAHRCSEIAPEWDLCNKRLEEEKDAALYGLLTNPAYNVPQRLPDGNYSGIPLTIVGSE